MSFRDVSLPVGRGVADLPACARPHLEGPAIDVSAAWVEKCSKI
jgi:hypothetical protein